MFWTTPRSGASAPAVRYRHDVDLDVRQSGPGGAVRCYTVTVDADAFNQTLGNVATPGPGGECDATG